MEYIDNNFIFYGGITHDGWAPAVESPTCPYTWLVLDIHFTHIFQFKRFDHNGVTSL